jgi:hypothetical protein
MIVFRYRFPVTVTHSDTPTINMTVPRRQSSSINVSQRSSTVKTKF